MGAIQTTELKPFPKRQFRVFFKGGAVRLVEADQVRFEGSWVVFGDGQDPAAHMTNLRAFSGILEIEEIYDNE